MKSLRGWFALPAVVLVGGLLWLLWPARAKSVPRSVIAAGQGDSTAQAIPKFAVKPEAPTNAVAEVQPDPERNPELKLDPVLLSPARWHPRPPGEWDGMLVNMNLSPPCESKGGCGLARACKEGRCVACEADPDCEVGEVCVLDHCIRGDNVACRRKADCGGRSFCVLDGYSVGLRANESMHSRCVDPLSGAASMAAPPIGPAKEDDRTSLPDDDLIRRAREAAVEPESRR